MPQLIASINKYFSKKNTRTGYRSCTTPMVINSFPPLDEHSRHEILYQNNQWWLYSPSRKICHTENQLCILIIVKFLDTKWLQLSMFCHLCLYIHCNATSDTAAWNVAASSKQGNESMHKSKLFGDCSPDDSSLEFVWVQKVICSRLSILMTVLWMDRRT